MGTHFLKTRIVSWFSHFPRTVVVYVCQLVLWKILHFKHVRMSWEIMFLRCFLFQNLFWKTFREASFGFFGSFAIYLVSCAVLLGAFGLSRLSLRSLQCFFVTRGRTGEASKLSFVSFVCLFFCNIFCFFPHVGKFSTKPHQHPAQLWNHVAETLLL